MTFKIEVKNRFEMTRGDIQGRRKSREEILEERLISSPAFGNVQEEGRGGSFSLEEEEDYLEISVASQQDELGPCKIDICSNGPFTFVPPGMASITVLPSEDVETNTSLRIPSSPPQWKLVIMRPPQQSSDVPGLIPRDEGTTVNVRVGDAPPGGWD